MNLLKRVVSHLLLTLSAMMLLHGSLLADDKKKSGKKSYPFKILVNVGENKEPVDLLEARSVIALGTVEEYEQAEAYDTVLGSLARVFPMCFVGTDESVVNTFADNVIKYIEGDGSTLYQAMENTLRNHWFEPDTTLETLYRQFGYTGQPVKPCDAISLSHAMKWSMRQTKHGATFFQRILAPLYKSSPGLTDRQKRVAVSGCNAETLWDGITGFYRPEEFVQIMRCSNYLLSDDLYDKYISRKDKKIVPEIFSSAEFYENFRMVNTFILSDPPRVGNEAGVGLDNFYSEEQLRMFRQSLESIEPDGDLIFIAAADRLAYQKFMTFMEPYIASGEFVLVAEGGADEALDDERCLRSQFFREIVDTDHLELCDFQQVVRFRRQGFVQMNLPETLTE